MCRAVVRNNAICSLRWPVLRNNLIRGFEAAAVATMARSRRAERVLHHSPTGLGPDPVVRAFASAAKVVRGGDSVPAPSAGAVPGAGREVEGGGRPKPSGVDVSVALVRMAVRVDRADREAAALNALRADSPHGPDVKSEGDDMRRRDISKILLASAAGTTLVAGRAQAQTCVAPCYARTDAEDTAGVTPTNYEYPPGDVRRYGAVGNGAADDTGALGDAYAACAAGHYTLFLARGIYRFTSPLAWNASVDVRGENGEFSILCKDGGIDGINISGAAQQSSYTDFTLDAINDAAGSFGRHGVTVVDGAHLTLSRVSILNHGGHGLYLVNATPTGFFSHYSNLSIVGNGGDGVRIDGHYAAYFENVDSRGNGKWGLNVLSPSAYHVAKHFIVQHNQSGGAQIAGPQNSLEIYAESNTGTDIALTSTSTRNLITNLHIDNYPSDLQDAGTDNTILSISGISGVLTASVSRPKRATNGAGLPVHLVGGHAGVGASAFPGGAATVSGGDAAGSGDANGGKVILRGGSGTGTGREGDVIINEASGLTVVGATSPPSASAKFAVVSTTGGLLVPVMTGAQRDAIAGPAEGLILFNSTMSKLQVRAGGAWVNLH
jgi:hypothetical protein